MELDEFIDFVMYGKEVIQNLQVLNAYIWEASETFCWFVDPQIIWTRKFGWKEISFYVGNLAGLGWVLGWVFVWRLNSEASELVGRGDARVWNNIDFLGAKMQLLCFCCCQG